MVENYIRELEKLKPEKEAFKVMISGTFDIVHTGHIFLINQAAKIGEVHVIVARDSSVKNFKGRPPIFPEKQRLAIIRSVKNVKWAELGSDTEDWVLRIVEVCPDLFLLGPNQYGDPDEYEKKVAERGCDTMFRRLETMHDEFKLNSSTKIRKKIIKNGF